MSMIPPLSTIDRSLAPKYVCNKVLIAETNSTDCMVLARSCCTTHSRQRTKLQLDGRIHMRQTLQVATLNQSNYFSLRKNHKNSKVTHLFIITYNQRRITSAQLRRKDRAGGPTESPPIARKISSGMSTAVPTKVR
jgi:hypothetical protein